MADDSVIIKKVIKKGGGGHHGGAWKVAYADFVTAMMAFFLLLWLLNATEAEQLAGLADYFAPTVGVKDQMGIGFRGGKAALSKGIGADRSTNRGIVFGGVPTGPIVKVTEKFELETEETDAEKFILLVGASSSEPAEEPDKEDESLSAAADSLQSYINGESDNYEDTVSVKYTVRGLEIRIKDVNKRSMFEGNTAELKKNVKRSLKKLTEVLQRLPNAISISGFTSSHPFVDENRRNYTNWELSVDRANAARRFMIENGLWAEQVVEVVGRSDNDPLNPREPFDSENNRIAILLLKESIIPAHKRAAPEKVIIDADNDSIKELLDDDKDGPEQEELQNTDKPVNSHLFEEEEITQEEVQEFESLPLDGVFEDGNEAAPDPFLNDGL